MNLEILELYLDNGMLKSDGRIVYLSLGETEKEKVNQMIFSLLKNGSCCQQESCPQD